MPSRPAAHHAAIVTKRLQRHHGETEIRCHFLKIWRRRGQRHAPGARHLRQTLAAGRRHPHIERDHRHGDQKIRLLRQHRGVVWLAGWGAPQGTSTPSKFAPLSGQPTGRPPPVCVYPPVYPSVSVPRNVTICASCAALNPRLPMIWLSCAATSGAGQQVMPTPFVLVQVGNTSRVL